MSELVRATEKAVVGHARDYLARADSVLLAELLDDKSHVAEEAVLSLAIEDAPALIDDLLVALRLELLAEDVPAGTCDDEEGAGLLVRLIAEDDPLLGPMARALLAAEGDRSMAAFADVISPALRARVAWHVAAMLRERHAHCRSAAIDQALCAAVRHCLAGHSSRPGRGALAVQLAAAMNGVAAGPGDTLSDLLAGALADRCLSLFVAFLAMRLDLDFSVAANLVLDRGSDMLWVAMRAAGLPRRSLARAAFTLAEADPRRDIEAFAERLDAFMSLPPDALTSAAAHLALDGEYRDAVRAVARLRDGR